MESVSIQCLSGVDGPIHMACVHSCGGTRAVNIILSYKLPACGMQTSLMCMGQHVLLLPHNATDSIVSVDH